MHMTNIFQAELEKNAFENFFGMQLSIISRLILEIRPLKGYNPKPSKGQYHI